MVEDAPTGALKFNTQLVVVIEVAEFMVGAANTLPVEIVVVLAVTLVEAGDVPFVFTD